MQARQAQNQNSSNGVDLDAIDGLCTAIQDEIKNAGAEFRVTTEWEDRMRSRSKIDGYRLGEHEVGRKFTLEMDQPLELLGENDAPNPQEMLLAAMNACLVTAYVTGASLYGITLETLEIESHAALDLRGFLGMDATIRPGYETIQYTVRIKGDGTPEQFRTIHETVMRTAPNYHSLAYPIRIDANLEVIN